MTISVRIALLAAGLVLTSFTTGCTTGRTPERLTAPRAIVAPFDAAQEVLWAVAPLRNESGTKVVEIDELTDAVIHTVEEVKGVRTVPYNRTVQAMRALKIDSIASPEDAQALAAAMGVDGVLVGSITAYDPYTPSLGLALALFETPVPAAADRVDPRSYSRGTTDAAPGRWQTTPVSTASNFLDGKNHDVLMSLRSYAEGRSRQGSALGWRRYTSSMPLFCEFASYQLVDELVRNVWVTTAAPAE